MCNTKKEADLIKIRLIKWLQKKYSNEIIIGNEVLYSIHQRRADLLMIKDNCMYAFEIKSEKDTILRLDEQLNDYITTFDFVYIVSTDKIRTLIKDKVPYNVGFISIDNEITLKRTAKQIKRLSKRNLAEFLDLVTMRHLMPKYNRKKISVYDVREQFSKNVSTQTIKKAAVDKLYKRYKKLYELFLYDTADGEILLEDLRSLTGNIREEIY